MGQGLIRAYAKAAGLPEPVPEYVFAAPRKWRFDYAWPDQKVALEVQGGLFIKGRHTQGSWLLKEHEKLNTAAALGWRVCYCTPTEFNAGEGFSRVAKCCRVVLSADEAASL